ncbi:MAG: DUF4411 family protein [Bacilli bacterium]|nr:DUF4411 family protein [Bacilli bacterium]
MPQDKYIIDSCSLITPFNGSYPMDNFPSFWDKLKEKILSGEIIICRATYDEVVPIGDDLSLWLKSIIDSGVQILEPDEDILNNFTSIVDHVDKHDPPYKASAVSEFMGCGDPFIMASAKSRGYIVITEEIYSPGATKRVKIPNVCLEESIQYMNLTSYIKKADFHF